MWRGERRKVGQSLRCWPHIYLHYVVDLWFERKIKPQFGGRAALVRYADDLCLFFEKSTEVDTMRSLLEARLEQFGLKLAEEKTHKTDLGEGPKTQNHERRQLTFLGFTIYRARSVGNTVIKTVFQTEGKRFSRAKARMKERIQQLQHQPVEQQARGINQILRGHFNYYGLAGNAKKLQSFWNFTWREWKHSLAQRSQNGRLSWEAFKALLKAHPLVRPRIRITYSTLGLYVRL